jgi:hypothetical protein
VDWTQGSSRQCLAAQDHAGCVLAMPPIVAERVQPSFLWADLRTVDTERSFFGHAMREAHGPYLHQLDKRAELQDLPSKPSAKRVRKAYFAARLAIIYL